jgi:hypothetical protein
MTMNSTHSPADRLTPIQEAAVRAELESILKSPHFSSSKRCQDLLEFVVNGALNQEFDSLTERFIGARVFGRPIEYETATDAIVRVRANDVRRRLSQYDLEQKKPSIVRITLTSGSYVPEFHFPSHPAGAALEEHAAHQPVDAANPASRPAWRSRKWLVLAIAAAVCLLIAAGLLITHIRARKGPVESFWAPILQNKGDILLCAGGNTFLQNPVPGFFTASKEIDYPYFSLQTEVSTALLSTVIERGGATPQFRFAASTPLPEFHEHPIILLNAYNNQWTLRLTDPLRYHFSTLGSHPQTIQDQQHPEGGWHRDPSLPYENSDDYALLARFWDNTTDNWVVVLAGLGRNGTEAASRFVVDEHYMQELRSRLGRDFGHLNIEVVLRVSVVDGKTGSPQIMAAYAW